MKRSHTQRHPLSTDAPTATCLWAAAINFLNGGCKRNKRRRQLPNHFLSLQNEVELGELLLSLNYLPSAGRLNVDVIRAKQLLQTDVSQGSGTVWFPRFSHFINGASVFLWGTQFSFSVSWMSIIHLRMRQVNDAILVTLLELGSGLRAVVITTGNLNPLWTQGSDLAFPNAIPAMETPSCRWRQCAETGRSNQWAWRTHSQVFCQLILCVP